MVLPAVGLVLDETPPTSPSLISRIRADAGFCGLLGSCFRPTRTLRCSPRTKSRGPSSIMGFRAN